MKSHTTCAAQVWLVVQMHPYVHSAKGCLSELLVTYRTVIWTLIGVNADVGLQDLLC